MQETCIKSISAAPMIISNRSHACVEYANYTNITGDNDWNIGSSLIDTMSGLNSIAVVTMQNTVFGKCNNWLQ